jgi:membrane peptidoglycan carboxypeptidase
MQSVSLLLAVSVVAGIIMAGMLLPFVGGLGLAARSATNNFASLPANIKAKPLPQVSRILTANGQTIATFYDQDRLSVPLSQIPIQMQQALIDVEDVRFYEHGGVDFKGTLRALLHNGSSGTVVQGGSTLTQQYVKNLLIENARTKKERLAAIADTLSRKIKEAKLAIGLERTESKDEILDNYFNIAYFGDGAYGIGTAARHFFGENVTALTLDQSALLAGLVQSPDAYNPRYYPKVARLRRDTVLGQMLKYHSINEATYLHAKAQPLGVDIHPQANDCVDSKYPYFCDYVKHVFQNTPGLSLTLLRRGGLTVTTTLSPKVQRAATAGVLSKVHRREPTSHVVGAEAVVQPGTGKVKALAVSTPYGFNKKKGENSINYAVGTSYGGSHGFHAGSTFKIFVLTAALKEGIAINHSIYAPNDTVIKGLTDCAGRTVADWPVHNAADGDESGNFNLDTGTWYSVNTFYAQLEQQTGVCAPVKLAESMGIKQGDGSPPQQIGPFVLGAGGQFGFTPLDLASAYATYAAHGMYCSPIVITSIVDRSGRNYPVPKANCQQVIPADLANTVTKILTGVLTQPGATGTSDILDNRVAAAKTGTVDLSAGSWFAGYTPQLAAAAMATNPNAPNKSLNELPIGGTSYPSVFGATIAGKIWQYTMNAALRNRPVEDFTGADNYYSAGLYVSVPDVTGDSPSDALATLTAAGFSAYIQSATVHSSVKAGLVAKTDPAAGATINEGSTVYIYTSDGTPKPTNTATSPPPTTGKTPPASPPASSPPASTPPGRGVHHRRHPRRG